MTDKEQEVVNHILSKAIKSDHFDLGGGYNYIGGQTERNLYLKNVRLLVEYNILKDIGGNKYEITNKGVSAKNAIGVEKHIESEKTKLKKISDKFDSDFKLSKWKAKTFWWFFVFAFLGFGLSIYNFINSLTIKEDTQQKGITPEEMESELSKLRTLILDQKNLDSLSNPNSQPNKQNP